MTNSAKVAFAAAIAEDSPVVVASRDGRTLNVGYSSCEILDLLWIIGELVVWLCRAQASDPVGAFDSWVARIRERVVDPRVGIDS